MMTHLRPIIATIAAALLPVSSTFAEETNHAAVSEGAIVQRDIAYVANPHPRQTFDLYLPPPDVKRPTPWVLWIHGGAWKLGSKDWINVRYLVQHGYAIASVDYRLSGDAKFPVQIQDCNAALQFLVTNAATYGLNPKRVIVGGGSAGGHLALLLGLARNERAFGADPSIRPLAILDFFGPVDFISLLEEVDQGHEREAAEDAFHRLLGASPATRPDLARLASPITYVSPGNPPVLILHGDKDASVPYQQSEQLHARLTQAGISNELITVKGVGHDGPKFATPELQQRVISFLQSLGSARPVTNAKP